MRISCAEPSLCCCCSTAHGGDSAFQVVRCGAGTHGVPCGWAEEVLPVSAPRRPISGANEPDLVRGCACTKPLTDEAPSTPVRRVGAAGGGPTGRWGIGLPGWRARDGALSLATMGEPSVGEPDGEDSNDGRGESKCWVGPAAPLACSFAASSCSVGWPVDSPLEFKVILGEAFLEKLTLFGTLAELNRSLLTVLAIGTTGVGRAPPSDWCNAATRACVDGSAKLGQRAHNVRRMRGMPGMAGKRRT